MATQEEALQINDSTNLYFTRVEDHSTRVLSPNDLPGFAFDSGDWTNELAASELEFYDAVYQNLLHTPSVDYAHMGAMFSFAIPTASTYLYTRYKIDGHLIAQNIGGNNDGLASFYIMNFTTGEWEKIGSDIVVDSPPFIETIAIDVDLGVDYTVDYEFMGYSYITFYIHTWDSGTAIPCALNFDDITFTLVSNSLKTPTNEDYYDSIKARVRAMTGFGTKAMPDDQLTILLEMSLDEMQAIIATTPTLSETSQMLAAVYYTCYLAMVAVYGPGIQRYRQDKNTVTFGDPYSQTKGSWYLQKFNNQIRKSRLLITKSDYDLRNYEADRHETMKSMPCTSSVPVLEPLTECPHCGQQTRNGVATCTCVCVCETDDDIDA